MTVSYRHSALLWRHLILIFIQFRTLLLPRILPTHCIPRLDLILPSSSFLISPCPIGGDTEFVREHMQQQFISKVFLDTISEHEGPVRAEDTGEEH
jgi:hypothetical protein